MGCHTPQPLCGGLHTTVLGENDDGSQRWACSTVVMDEPGGGMRCSCYARYHCMPGCGTCQGPGPPKLRQVSVGMRSSALATYRETHHPTPSQESGRSIAPPRSGSGVIPVSARSWLRPDRHIGRCGVAHGYKEPRSRQTGQVHSRAVYGHRLCLVPTLLRASRRSPLR